MLDQRIFLNFLPTFFRNTSTRCRRFFVFFWQLENQWEMVLIVQIVNSPNPPRSTLIAFVFGSLPALRPFPFQVFQPRSVVSSDSPAVPLQWSLQYLRRKNCFDNFVPEVALLICFDTLEDFFGDCQEQIRWAKILEQKLDFLQDSWLRENLIKL